MLINFENYENSKMGFEKQFGLLNIARRLATTNWLKIAGEGDPFLKENADASWEASLKGGNANKRFADYAKELVAHETIKNANMPFEPSLQQHFTEVSTILDKHIHPGLDGVIDRLDIMEFAQENTHESRFDRNYKINEHKTSNELVDELNTPKRLHPDGVKHSFAKESATELIDSVARLQRYLSEKGNESLYANETDEHSLRGHLKEQTLDAKIQITAEKIEQGQQESHYSKVDRAIQLEINDRHNIAAQQGIISERNARLNRIVENSLKHIGYEEEQRQIDLAADEWMLGGYESDDSKVGEPSTKRKYDSSLENSSDSQTDEPSTKRMRQTSIERGETGSPRQYDDRDRSALGR